MPCNTQLLWLTKREAKRREEAAVEVLVASWLLGCALFCEIESDREIDVEKVLLFGCFCRHIAVAEDEDNRRQMTCRED